MEVKVTVLPSKYWFGQAKFKTECIVSMQNIVVPQGYVTDGATIPRWIAIVGLLIVLLFFNITLISFFGCLLVVIPVVFSNTDTYFAAAIVHDYCITSKICSRKLADKIFLLCLKQLKVSFIRYYPMYLAVRMWSILNYFIRV